ncbi:hypothetical protein FS837_010098 [Tulasnella sp. UAMH 9824]|nr:hypothetical protein FS837_010098 [Tulasnella sp. UAMH 9824]
MSSSDDLPPTNRSSYTKNESGCISRPNFLDTFPDELILYTLSFPSLPAVAQFASTSRRHRSIASAEHIWFPVALGIIKDNVDPNDTLVDEKSMRLNANRFFAALELGETEPFRVWYRIGTRLLKRVEWTLRWWLGKTDQLTKGCLWRIFIEIEQHDNRFLRVLATHVEVDENNDYNLQLPPGGPLSIREIPLDISALDLPGDDAWPSVSVEGFVPLDSRLMSRGLRSGYLSLNSQDLINTNSLWYSARKLQDHLPHLKLETDSWKRITGRQWHTSFSDAPYPPPPVGPAVRLAGRSACLRWACGVIDCASTGGW